MPRPQRPVPLLGAFGAAVLALPAVAPSGVAQTQAVQWQRLPSATPSQPQPTGAPSWQVVSPKPQPNGTTPSGGSPVWTPVPRADDGQSASGRSELVWAPVPAGEPTLPGTGSEATATKPQPPNSAAEAAAILKALTPTQADYPPLLRLGPAVPTANQLGEQQGQFSAFTLSPFSGGAATGTGNQNYAIRLDGGLTDQLQVSGFYSNADDPLYAPITGKAVQPGNFWESYGGALQWQLLNQKAWKLGLGGSLEGWNVGSGGGDSFTSKNQPCSSPNIFNNSGCRVFTRNVVGSVTLPISWQAAQQWQLTVTPGVSFLPSSQGAGQGGAGTFYGNNPFISGGVSWQPSRHLALFTSALMPVGDGANAFNGDLVFSRVPILSGGVNWALNPRIGLEGLLTNGWGATPATALLALPSSNRLGYMARFTYTPAAADTPQPELTPRQRSIALGGLTVNTALVPPDGTTELWANADSGGNIFGYAGQSLSNIFQLDLIKAGWFNNVPQTTPLADTYTTNGAWQFRIGGKAVTLSPLRGFPIWAAGRISFGRELPPGSGQGYAFAESILTWEANRTLALHLNPKLAWSGVGTPWGFGLGANIQLGQSFQLIPEFNLVASSFDQSNGSLALRWLAKDSLKVDVYVSNAAGLLDMGQLLAADQARVGGRVILSF